MHRRPSIYLFHHPNHSSDKNEVYVQNVRHFANATHFTRTAVIWLKYCRYGVKHCPISTRTCPCASLGLIHWTFRRILWSCEQLHSHLRPNESVLLLKLLEVWNSFGGRWIQHTGVWEKWIGHFTWTHTDCAIYSSRFTLYWLKYCRSGVQQYSINQSYVHIIQICYVTHFPTFNDSISFLLIMIVYITISDWSIVLCFMPHIGNIL